MKISMNKQRKTSNIKTREKTETGSSGLKKVVIVFSFYSCGRWRGCNIGMLSVKNQLFGYLFN
jgi:hypothetical protein